MFKQTLVHPYSGIVLLIRTTAWVDFRGVMLNEKNKKSILKGCMYGMIPFISHS